MHPAARRRLRRAARGVAVVAALGALSVGLNLVVGAGAAAQDDDGADSDALVQRGRDIYGAQCATCHAEQGRGQPEEGYPPLQDVGPAAVDFYVRTGRMPLQPGDRIIHREPTLDESQRRALIAYISTFPGEGPAIPDVGDWESASLTRGLELFTTDCAACHGPTAAGIAVGQSDIAPALDVATPLEIAEAVRIGPGVMPVFGEEALPEEDLQAVIRWVLHLRERAAPGGAQIGRSGPVTEGFVAWLLGMGGLAIVMYLLGEKAGNETEEASGGD